MLGMTRGAYEVLRPALTVQTRRRQPNPLAASPLVRTALELTGFANRAVVQQNEPTYEDVGAVVGEDAEALGGEIVIVREGPTRTQSRIPIYTIHAEVLTADGSNPAMEYLVRFRRNGAELYAILDVQPVPAVLFGPREAVEDNS